MRALGYLISWTVVSGCATSEEIPPLPDIDAGAAANGGGTGGEGAGGLPGIGGAPSNGGRSNGGAAGGGNAGAAGTCTTANCPSCSATFGQACCRNDGTCGCKGLFGLLNCM